MCLWCLYIKTLCLASIVFVDFPNVDSSIFVNIDPLDSSSPRSPILADSRNEKLRRIVLSYTPSPVQLPAANDSRQALLQPSISSASYGTTGQRPRPPIHYPIVPPPDVEVFDPSTYPGSRPDVGGYPPIPVHPPSHRPPVFLPPHPAYPPFRPPMNGPHSPFQPPDDVEMFDPSANKPIPIPLFGVKSLQLFVPFSDKDAVLFESRENKGKVAEIESRDESSDGEDRAAVVFGQSKSTSKKFEQSQNGVKATSHLVNATTEKDLARVINSIKDIVFKDNATLPGTSRVMENYKVNAIKNETRVTSNAGQENFADNVTPVKYPVVPSTKNLAADTPCKHLFDLVGKLMKIATDKKPDRIVHEDDSAQPESPTFYPTYEYHQPLVEWEPESSQVTDYVYDEFVQVPIVYTFDYSN